MNIKYWLAAAAMCCFVCLPSWGKGGRNYYVDSQHGSDQADGRSMKNAWKSLAPTKDLRLQPGDSLLFRRGTVINGVLEISAQGKANKRIVVDAYGTGRKPCIQAPDASAYAVLVRNSDYVTLQHLEVVNTGRERLAGRTGVKVECRDYGVSHDIVLSKLYVHDVNGSLIKQKGGGSGILIVNGGRKVVSVFDGLLIENCVLRRCERNGIIWGGYTDRKNWHPSTRVVVRKNLLDEVPGDGIVPIGCDGTLIEYNLMRNCPGVLPHSEAAAGFWPWSCDNTVMQFNEVSDHKAPWDAQGFDSDYNCQNTVIRYNYSHDNDGGMVLICNAGVHAGVGNRGTVVEYNVSINDALRPRAARDGIFSPSIHIGGPCKNTLVSRNILHVNPKPASFIDRTMITSDTWNGYADSTVFRENVFFAPQESAFRLTRSTNNTFEGNYYLGTYNDKPADAKGKSSSNYYNEVIAKDPSGFSSLSFLFDHVIVGDGEAVMKVVNPEVIGQFFDKMKE